jgi:hypothetical protein
LLARRRDQPLRRWRCRTLPERFLDPVFLFRGNDARCVLRRVGLGDGQPQSKTAAEHNNAQSG